MGPAGRVRAHVVEGYVDPARSRGDEMITVVAKDVLRALRLRSDYAPSVCSALRTKKFCKENELELIRQDGPPSKQSTTTSFTYRLLGGSASRNDRPARKGIWSLLGAGKETFAALGGGERWLRREREAFNGSTADARSVNRQGSSG